jgi:hypothetical protein
MTVLLATKATGTAPRDRRADRVGIERLGTATAFVLATALAHAAQTASVMVARHREQLLPVETAGMYSG